jgi:hypothetical protein
MFPAFSVRLPSDIFTKNVPVFIYFPNLKRQHFLAVRVTDCAAKGSAAIPRDILEPFSIRLESPRF